MTVQKTRIYWTKILVIKKLHIRGFPGGAVVKNPPANAGNEEPVQPKINK